MQVRQPAVGDAFGAVLRRCWAAGGVPGVAFELVERDDGFLTAGDAARYFAAPEQWVGVERWACDQATGRVLDVGCGAGRHAVPLAAAGCEVVGLDRSPGAVAVTRSRGVRAVQGALLEAGAELGTFDTIVLLGNNLGLLGGPEQAPAVLGRLAGLARPGARLLGSGVDAYATDAAEHHAYHAWNRHRGRAGSQVRVRIRDRMLATEWFDYWFASLAELSAAVAGGPWRLAVAEEESAGRYAVRLDLVGRRPPAAGRATGLSTGSRTGPRNGPGVEPVDWRGIGPGTGPRNGPGVERVDGPGIGPGNGPVDGPGVEPVDGPGNGPGNGPGVEPVDGPGVDGR